MQRQRNTNLQKPLQGIVLNIEKFSNSVGRINHQIDEICNQIREIIEDFLTAWKHYSQKASKEELVRLWEDLEMYVDDEYSEDPIFWFSSYAKISVEEGDIVVSLYIRKGDSTLYADDNLPSVSYPVKRRCQEEYCIDLDACNFNNLTEIMDTIYYSLNSASIKMKTLQNTSHKRLKNF